MAPQRIRVDCTEWSVCDKKVVTVQLVKNVDRSKDKDKVCDKNGNVLPTGQWYAPSVVINEAWYCMVLHGIAWYFMVLHGIAWYCMVLHGTTWYCMALHDIKWY